MKNNLSGFSLIELMIAILIFTIIILAWFQALAMVNAWKLKLIESTQITKDTNYFAEKLYEEIKLWGTIDYEEYFARSVRGDDDIWSGHYLDATGFWNYGQGGNVGTSVLGNDYFYCISGDNESKKLAWNGCINDEDTSHNNTGDQGNSPMRYGEYALQFIDYNSNYDSDTCVEWGVTIAKNGDEDGDCNILWDDDDEHLGMWPDAFASGTNVHELYLISWDGRKRTFFRWNWKQDPSAPPWVTCDGSATLMGSGCIGSIQILKMIGSDEGMGHDWAAENPWSNDGKIDTWKIDPDFATLMPLAGSWTIDSYWQDIFPQSMSVTRFEVYPYPNTDRRYAWKDFSPSINLNPYVRIKVSLTPSRKKRSGMQWKIPEVDLSTTINLSDYFTQ